jgi:hypothetical protein
MPTYRVRIEAKVPQVVLCDSCGGEFLYFMQKTGGAVFGAGVPLADAEEVARRSLAKKLAIGNCNPVPCPHCYRFQAHMRDQAAQDAYGKNLPFSGFLFIFGGIWLGIGVLSLATGSKPDAFGWVFLLVPGVSAVLFGCGFYLYQKWAIANYDPNSLPEEKREKLAAERCMTWDEFDRRQEKRIAKRYAEHVAKEQRAQWLTNPKDREQPAPVRLWLPARAFQRGLSTVLQLTADQQLAVEMAPETDPGKVIELPLRGQNEFPFRVVLLNIDDYYSEMEDED